MFCRDALSNALHYAAIKATYRRITCVEQGLYAKENDWSRKCTFKGLRQQNTFREYFDETKKHDYQTT